MIAGAPCAGSGRLKIDRSSVCCVMSDAQLDDLANLIEAAIRHLDDDEPNPDTPTGWAAISRLQSRTDNSTLARAIALCESANGKQRRVGAAILGQLGHSSSSGGVFRSERFGALKQLAEGEARRDQDPEVLGDALVALGHLNDDRAIPVAVSLIGHSSAKVRRGVVMALSRHDDESAIGGLIQLSCDSDDDIREWATFGLGMLIDTDTDGIRAALLVRLTDDHPDVRVEAIAGLARRGSKSRP